jgi:hypothetical protein
MLPRCAHAEKYHKYPNTLKWHMGAESRYLVPVLETAPEKSHELDSPVWTSALEGVR